MRVHRIVMPGGPEPHGPPSANAWLLPDPPVTLVDSGAATMASQSAVVSALNAEGLELKDLEMVLLTHTHPDHAGFAGTLATRTGADVYVPAAELDVLHDPAGARKRRWDDVVAFLQEAGVPDQVVSRAARSFQVQTSHMTPVPQAKPYPDGLLEAGGVILEPLPAPGHSPGHVVLHSPKDGVIFTGDALLKIITTPAYRLTAGDVLALGRHLRSLEMMLGLPVRRVFPGHGESFDDYGAVLARNFSHHARRGERLQRMLADAGPATARSLASAMFLEKGDALFAVSEVQGHLDLMEQEGLAASELRDGVRSWWSTAPPEEDEDES